MGDHINKGREGKMRFNKGHESFNLEVYDVCPDVLNSLEVWQDVRFSLLFFCFFFFLIN